MWADTATNSRTAASRPRCLQAYANRNNIDSYCTTDGDSLYLEKAKE